MYQNQDHENVCTNHCSYLSVTQFCHMEHIWLWNKRPYFFSGLMPRRPNPMELAEEFATGHRLQTTKSSSLILILGQASSSPGTSALLKIMHFSSNGKGARQSSNFSPAASLDFCITQWYVITRQLFNVMTSVRKRTHIGQQIQRADLVCARVLCPPPSFLWSYFFLFFLILKWFYHLFSTIMNLLFWMDLYC